MELTTQNQLKFLIRDRWNYFTNQQRAYVYRNWFNKKNPIAGMSQATFYNLMGDTIGNSRRIDLGHLMRIQICMNEFLPEELKFKEFQDIISPNYLKVIQNEQTRLLQGEAN
jgi:hypothetical protein